MLYCLTQVLFDSENSPDEANYVAKDNDGHIYYLNICGDLNPVGPAAQCVEKYPLTKISACQDKPGDDRFPHHAGSRAVPQLFNPVWGSCS